MCRQQVIFPLGGGCGGRFLMKGSGRGGYPDGTCEWARKVQEAILRAIAKANHLVAGAEVLGLSYNKSAGSNFFPPSGVFRGEIVGHTDF